MTRHALDLTINGEDHQLMVEPHWSLLHVLRRELGMTGTKENCLEAECGVCTVLLDGKAVNSCILLAEQAAAGRSSRSRAWAIPSICTRCRRPSSSTAPCSAATAFPAMILTAKSFLDECRGHVPTKPRCAKPCRARSAAAPATRRSSTP